MQVASDHPSRQAAVTGRRFWLARCAATYSVTDLGSLGYGVTDGLAINAVGQVTGFGPDWTNDSGEIAGTCASGACVLINGTFTQLSNPPGLGCGSAIAINHNGEILGGCGDFNSDSRAAVWENGMPIDLDTLGGRHRGCRHQQSRAGRWVASDEHRCRPPLSVEQRKDDPPRGQLLPGGDQRQRPNRRRRLRHRHLPDTRAAANTELTDRHATSLGGVIGLVQARRPSNAAPQPRNGCQRPDAS